MPELAPINHLGEADHGLEAHSRQSLSGAIPVSPADRSETLSSTACSVAVHREVCRRMVKSRYWIKPQSEVCMKLRWCCVLANELGARKTCQTADTSSWRVARRHFLRLCSLSLVRMRQRATTNVRVLYPCQPSFILLWPRGLCESSPLEDMGLCMAFGMSTSHDRFEKFTRTVFKVDLLEGFQVL